MDGANARWRGARDPISQLLVSAAARERTEGSAARGRGSCQCRSLTRGGSTRPPPYITTDNECWSNACDVFTAVAVAAVSNDTILIFCIICFLAFVSTSIADCKLESLQGYQTLL